MLNEGVEEFVVEGLVPGLTGKHCAEVRAALAHDRLKADHGGAHGLYRHVLGRSREPVDVRPVMSEHRLVWSDRLDVLGTIKKLVRGSSSRADCVNLL